jgi:hypothetical protein
MAGQLNPNKCARDSEGNIFIIGSFDNNVVFGTQSVVSTDADRAFDLTSDSERNIYLTGSFSSNVNFGTGPIFSTNNSEDIFLAKFNSLGDIKWVSTSSSDYNNSSSSVVLLDSQNIYTVGRFVGNIFLGNTIKNAKGVFDLCLAA